MTEEFRKKLDNGQKAERSLDFILTGGEPIHTARFSRQGQAIARPPSYDGIHYGAVEWNRDRWLVMHIRRWEHLFGAEASIDLERALFDECPDLHYEGTYKERFGSNNDGRWDLGPYNPYSYPENALINLLCPPVSPPVSVTAECKRDFNWAPRTREVFVEIEQVKNRNSPAAEWKPSGIAVSDATFWAFNIRMRVWVILRNEDLRTLVEQATARG